MHVLTRSLDSSLCTPALEYYLLQSSSAGTGSTGAPRLCSLPLTIVYTEAFVKNMKRAHFQVAQRYAALDSDPQSLDPREYSWEADDINKSLSVVSVPAGVLLTPDHVLWLFDVAVSQTPLANQRTVDA